jgi:hypothetical protein
MKYKARLTNNNIHIIVRGSERFIKYDNIGLPSSIKPYFKPIDVKTISRKVRKNNRKYAHGFFIQVHLRHIMFIHNLFNSFPDTF